MCADIIILSGPPGAGKTATARALATRFPEAVHLHTDDFWHVIVSGAIPPHLPQADEQNQTVLAVIARAAWTYATGGYTTVVDGVIGPWMLRHFEAAAADEQATVVRRHYIVLRPERDEALRRARGRTWPAALTTEGPITAMWDQFADLGPLEHHALDTTTQSPDDTVAAVQQAITSGRFLLA